MDKEPYKCNESHNILKSKMKMNVHKRMATVMLYATNPESNINQRHKIS